MSNLTYDYLHIWLSNLYLAAHLAANLFLGRHLAANTYLAARCSGRGGRHIEREKLLKADISGFFQIIDKIIDIDKK